MRKRELMHIVRFQGGFANQLFQLCLYKKLEQLFGNDNVYADISHFKTCQDHGGFKLAGKINLNYLKKKPDDCLEIRESNISFSCEQGVKNYYYNGYWQDEAFFPTELDFLNVFFDVNTLSEENLKLIEEMKKCESVSAHVRRGDYVDNYLHGNISNKAYIINSINYICDHIDDPVFYVFSDDINWCKENIPANKGRIIYVTGNEKYVENDILMMSHCKHNIISNSSFSWWAQKLNKNEEKIVISPEYWYNDNIEGGNLLSEKFVKCSNLPFVKKTLDIPLFSIIVPVYNSEVSIKRCASSILNQTYENIEAIFVDDCSSDSSSKILEEYKKNDVRVKVIHKEKNESLLSAKISGMRIARGDFAIFVDSNDYLSNSACEILQKNLNAMNVDILEFGYYSEPKRELFTEKSGFDNRVVDILNQKSSHMVWNKCYSKHLISKMLSESKTFYCNVEEDEYLSVLTFELAESYASIDDGLYHHSTFGETSHSSNLNMEMLNNALVSIQNKDIFLREYLKERGKPFYETMKKESVEHLVELCLRQEAELDIKIKMLRTIDSFFSTDYSIQYEKELNNRYYSIEQFNNSSFKSQIKQMTKFVLKRISQKFEGNK